MQTMLRQMEQKMFIITLRVSQVRIRSHVWSQRGEHNLNWARWNQMKCTFYTTCLWPLPVHTWMLSGIIIPPLLHDPGRHSICVIHQLEASDIGSTLPEFGQVNVHEPLVQERNRRSSSEEDTSRWERGILLMYEYGRQLRRNIFPLGGNVQLRRGTSSPAMVWTCFSHRFWAGHILQLPPREKNNHINNSSLARKLAE